MGPRLRYLVQELGIGLRRNLLMTIATIVTFVVCLSLLGIGLLVQKQVNTASDLFYAQVEVSIFLQDGITETQRASLESELREHPVVDEVLFESKEEAYAHFQELFADSPSMLDGVTPDILPASFRVQLADPEEYLVIESQFRNHPGVQEVSNQSEVLENIFTLLRYLRDGALGIALIQGFGAAALIFTMIRMAAFARREQIGIMKLVGATNWYIRLPFLLEGVIAAVIGAVLAVVLLVIAAGPLLQGARDRILFVPILGPNAVLEIAPFLLVVAVAVAALSSIASLRRFLAV